MKDVDAAWCDVLLPPIRALLSLVHLFLGQAAV